MRVLKRIIVYLTLACPIIAFSNDINTRKNIEIGRCYMGSCSWSKEISVEKIGESSKGTLFTKLILGGNSQHKGVNYPNFYNSNIKINWNKEPHNVYVFCSKTLPAVMMGDQVDFLDVSFGIPGVLISSLEIYSDTCHRGQIKKDEVIEDALIKKFNYKTNNRAVSRLKCKNCCMMLPKIKCLRSKQLGRTFEA